MTDTLAERPSVAGTIRTSRLLLARAVFDDFSEGAVKIRIAPPATPAAPAMNAIVETRPNVLALSFALIASGSPQTPSFGHAFFESLFFPMATSPVTAPA